MPKEYDIDGLAAYLHLDPVQVKKMAERGKLPGRRHNGGWRFAHAEIHHWLEGRILGSDVREQARIEEVLERHAGDAEELSMEALLPLEAVAVPLSARTKTSVVSAMTELAAETGWLWDPDKMTDAVRQREEMYPTAIAGGLALMHPRRPMGSILGRPFLAFGRTTRGVPFGDPSGDLTDLFFLILSVDDANHLRTLARLGRVLGTKGVLDDLRAAEDAPTALEVLLSAERGLSS
jgi:PTS system nitrogen regulatory IIA component